MYISSSACYFFFFSLSATSQFFVQLFICPWHTSFILFSSLLCPILCSPFIVSLWILVTLSVFLYLSLYKSLTNSSCVRCPWFFPHHLIITPSVSRFFVYSSFLSLKHSSAFSLFYLTTAFFLFICMIFSVILNLDSSYNQTLIRVTGHRWKLFETKFNAFERY